ncbi:two-component system response regulator [Hahella sp. CCB-MM4]|uniref:response regulator n=1 Tax=Hahella sp. (strain CCB-MM4) TaxID=1926491 RepID=UPI000B9AB878|nr:response regulator [Hahella sp. CCB-MM4]OZG75060.1 two-component system response regulator [Hahella sp. CCB-MM4]
MSVKVLIVDDASFVRDMVKRSMRTYFPDAKVEEAINGRKAQFMMSKTHYDLILCDWEMPEMSGLELLQWARKHETYQKVPFVMVTSRGDRGHVVEAVQEGVSDYLSKPFSPEMLAQKVVKQIGKKLKQARSPQSSSSTLGGDSASVLTGASDKAKQSPAPKVTEASLTGSAALLTGDSAKPAAEKTVSAASKKALAQIRFADFNLPCVIKSITLNEVKVVARRGERFPMILDPAVVDIEVSEGGTIERINGYVHMLQAVEKRVDTDFISLVIRFVDEDPDKMASLSKFIASF